MKKLVTCITAVALAFGLLFMNATSAAAASANAATPTATDVAAEAKSTAAYVLSQSSFTSLSDTSSFNNASKRLILAIRCGADYQSALNSYLTTVQSLLNSDGTLNVSVAAYGYPNDTIADYASLLMVLALSHNDATNFHGVNIVNTFKTILDKTSVSDLAFGYDSATYANTGMNPYYLGIVYDAVHAYSTKISTSSDIITKLKQSLLSISDEKGCNYYGYSIDNNGSLYPQFSSLYQSDANVQKLIDKILTYSEATYFNKTDGSSTNYGTSNADSTALALAFYAQYGKTQNAALSYHALLTYKSATTPGCYIYGSDDSLFSAQDALNGLVTYLRVLNEQTSPYDVSDILSLPANAASGNTNINPTSTDSTTTTGQNNTDNNTTGAGATGTDSSSTTTAPDTAAYEEYYNSSSANVNGSVATGDDTNFFLLVMLLAISAAFISIMSRKISHNDII